MLTEDLRKQIADDIYRCFREKSQIPLLNPRFPDIEMDDAYHIQEQVVSRFIADGQRVSLLFPAGAAHHGGGHLWIAGAIEAPLQAV